MNQLARIDAFHRRWIRLLARPAVEDHTTACVYLLDDPHDAVIAERVSNVEMLVSRVDVVKEEHGVDRHASDLTRTKCPLPDARAVNRESEGTLRARAASLPLSLGEIAFAVCLHRGATAGEKGGSATPLHTSCHGRGGERG